MKLPWRQAVKPAHGRPRGAQEADPEVQSCPSLPPVLEKVLKHERARILDLGPLCGESVVYLAGRGARVSVEAFEAPLPVPPRDPRRPDDPVPPKPPLRFDQEDGAFHLVLAWEHADFVPPERLSDFGSEIHRVLAAGGFVLLLARNVSADKESDPGGSWRRPGRFRLLGDDKMVREVEDGPERRRWVHPNREIERGLDPLRVQGVHLRRNQVREFLLRRAPE